VKQQALLIVPIVILSILGGNKPLSIAAALDRLQPEVLCEFHCETMGPATLVVGNDGTLYGTTYSGGSGTYGTVCKVDTNGALVTLASFNCDNGAYPEAGLVLGNDGNFYGTTKRRDGSPFASYGMVFKVSTNDVLTSLALFDNTNGAFPNRLVSGRDGSLYGTTSSGGSSGYGTVFKVSTNGVLTTLVCFDGANGETPLCGLVLGHDSNFYGTTMAGGSSPYPGYGTVFKVTPNGTLTTLVAFNNANGQAPNAGLVLGNDGNFYGTTRNGGNSLSPGYETVFKVTPSGVLTTLASFGYNNGAYPETDLVLGNNGNFYGTTSEGGGIGSGTVFKVTPSGVLTTLLSFGSTNGEGPYAGLVLGNDGNFYGTTYNPSQGNGTVFKLTPNGTLTTLVSWGTTEYCGEGPCAGLALGNDGNFYGTTCNGGDSAAGTVFRLTAGGMLASLDSFNSTNGAHPQAGLVLGNDGNFYGTTSEGGGGAYPGYGTVFKVNTNGVLSTLVSFNRTNGANPYAGLVPDTDGNFYGTTSAGGSSPSPGYGTVFKITPNGMLTTLVSFNGANGANPKANLLLGNDGNFYGTTMYGGSYNDGTVFKVTPSGMLTTLASLTTTNGAYPVAGLVLGGDANFYGTTPDGGSYYYGTVFKLTPNGTLTTLVSFNRTNGANPKANLLLGNDGNFYGTTMYGGSYNEGTVFKVTPNGILTTLASFTTTDGARPVAGLVLGKDGNFYGTSDGTVFKVTPNGVLTIVSSFHWYDIASPEAGLVLGNDGSFYGTTTRGVEMESGGRDSGTVFKVTPNGVLTPLVETGAGSAGLALGTDGSFYFTQSGVSLAGGAGYGGVFKVTSDGELTTLVSFNGANGANPNAGLVLGNDANFYGTTMYGGSYYYGTVFKVTTNGVLTTLFSFSNTNGANPKARLMLDNNGNLLGTTHSGGSGNSGTVFKVNTNGALSTLVFFNGADGANPLAGLVPGTDGNFYGTTMAGGSSPYPGYGTVFKVTPNGMLTTLISFNRTNGANPKANLMLGNDGNFYGTTMYGGSYNDGTVFKVTTNGMLSTLVSFNYANGAYPQAELLVGSDGTFYGTTTSGGTGDGGTVFRLVAPANFTGVTRQTGGRLFLSGTGPANQGFRLWVGADLSLPFWSWAVLTSGSFDTNGNFSCTDSNVLATPSRFYRLSLP
jgi:uncharacterized repeat protein (TIGR03803 family)